MGKESVVEIPVSSGNKYRYSYDPETRKTTYLGPMGDSPEIGEEEFLLTFSEIEKGRKPIEDRVKVVHRKRKTRPDEMAQHAWDVYNFFTLEPWVEYKGNVVIVDRLDRSFIEGVARKMKDHGVIWAWEGGHEERTKMAGQAIDDLIERGWMQVKTTKGSIINPNISPEVREFEEKSSPWK